MLNQLTTHPQIPLSSKKSELFVRKITATGSESKMEEQHKYFSIKLYFNVFFKASNNISIVKLWPRLYYFRLFGANIKEKKKNGLLLLSETFIYLNKP